MLIRKFRLNFEDRVVTLCGRLVAKNNDTKGLDKMIKSGNHKQLPSSFLQGFSGTSKLNITMLNRGFAMFTNFR